MQIPKPIWLAALCALPLLNRAHAAVDLAVQPSTIGHTFPIPGPPTNQLRSVADYLVDQDQGSGGGGVLPAVSVNWDTNTQFTLTVSAPPGHKFSIRVPAGRAVEFGVSLRWESTGDGFSPTGSVAVLFGGLEGTPPIFFGYGSVLSDSHGFFGFADLPGTLVTTDFAFTSIRLTAGVAPQVTGNGTEDYIPNVESSMRLSYQTPETNDPGRFVFIVPAGTNGLPTNNVPVVSWFRPTNGSSFAAASSILLRATASDSDSNGALRQIDFLAGTNLLGRVSASSNGTYNFMWSNAPAGTFQLHAEAMDNAGARGISSSAQIVVTNGPQTNNLPPVVNLTRPTNGAVFPQGSLILLTASASDPDGTLTLIDFLSGTNLLRRLSGPLTNGVYNFAWTNAPVGSFSLRAEAMDNRGARSASPSVQVVVSVTNVPPTNNVAPVDLGIVEASTIGHAVFTPEPTNSPPARTVADFLIDQDQSSGGGGMLPAVSVDWDTNSQFKLTVAAPAGIRFVVAAPAGSVVKFGGFLLWESTQTGSSAPGLVTAHYTDLDGTAPEFSQNDSVLSDSHGYFGFIDLESTGVTNSFSFTALTLTATVPPQYTGNGNENYLPHLECSLHLYHSTTNAEDPGSFISMVPTGPLPIIRMTGASPERGVDLVAYGRPGRTHIVECSTNTSSWITIGSGVMPPSSAIKLRDASATTVSSRFYRVVELP